MLWSEVKPEDLRKGDKIHVFQGEFNQLEATVEQDDNGDTYAEGVGWFTDSQTDDAPDWSRRWEILHRLNVEPEEPGLYVTNGKHAPAYLLEKRPDGVWLSSRNTIVTGGWDYVADRWAPIERVYTEAELKAQIAEAKKAVD